MPKHVAELEHYCI